MPEPDGFTIIVPALNEEAGIARSLEQIRRGADDVGRPYEVLVVDDGSTDGTADAARRLGATVVQHPNNMGYGASLKTGIRHARYDDLIIIDADCTYPADRIGTLLAVLPECDMVVGARTGDAVHIPLIRRPAKWVLRKLANYLSRTRIPDLNSGFRAFRRCWVSQFLSLLPSGFSFTTTVTLAALCDGYLVRYIPIDYMQRAGRSHIRPIKDTLAFLSLIVRTVVFFNPLRFFMPVSLAVLLAAAGLLIYQASRGDITTASVVVLVTGLQFAATGLLADLVSRSRGRPAPPVHVLADHSREHDRADTSSARAVARLDRASVVGGHRR